ncbi:MULTISPECIES: hypothetical protein [Pseudomonas]|nr:MULTISPECIES: hypothetical protein [Pseudomonas]
MRKVGERLPDVNLYPSNNPAGACTQAPNASSIGQRRQQRTR